MSFIFTMRSTPVGSTMHQTPSLPPIDEDGASYTSPRAPPVPPRAWNRPVHKVFGLGAPPRLNFEGSPPAYSQFDSRGVEGPNGEKLSEIRKGVYNNKHIAKRGGWRRLLLIALVAVAIIVALAVGLTVGLRNRHHNTTTSSSVIPPGGASGNVPSGPTNPASNTTFPAGSYRFDTFLDTVSTNCTSNAATWNCYPYHTYASSPSLSGATFDWIITPMEGSSNYTITSTENVFSIMFSNATLSFMNSGTDQEHYFFQITMQKPTVPSTALTSSNVAATCYFNQTTFHAYLYTKMEKTYPKNSTATNTTEPFAPWPYAVKIEEVSASGAGTPTCVDYSGKSLGNFSTSEVGLCDCLYLNTGT